MIVEKMVNSLPDNYNKSNTSNNYKFIKLAADQIENGENIMQLISDWRDIDQAQGVTLDKLGKDVGQPRGPLDDEAYRQKIKIKIRANLSGGEIETLNSITVVLVGNRFDGIQEGWTLPVSHPVGARPAMMLFTVKSDGINYGIPMAEIDEISAGGVAANWELLIKKAIDIGQTDYEHWSAPYQITNEVTASIAQQPTAFYITGIEASTRYIAGLHSMLKTGDSKVGEGVIL